jgi:transposase InsO family protein
MVLHFARLHGLTAAARRFGVSARTIRRWRVLGIRHRYIKPRRPQQNGKVERSHRIDHEEFWGRQRFADFAAATVGLRAWETRHNDERFSLAFQGRPPAEKLATLLPAPAA